MSRLLIAILILALSYYPVLYLATWWAKDNVITKLINATKSDERDTLEAYINWEKLRTFMKRNLKNKAESIRKARSVPSFGPPAGKIDKLVDHYVTPKGIGMALAIKDMRYPETSPRAFIADSRIEAPSAFAITLALPEKVKGKSGPKLNKGQRRLANMFMRVRFVIERQGWDWRWQVTKMHVPVFLVPPEVYTLDQVKQKLNQAGPM